MSQFKKRVAVYDTLVVKPLLKKCPIWWSKSGDEGYPNPNQEDLLIEIKRDYHCFERIDIIWYKKILGP